MGTNAGAKKKLQVKRLKAYVLENVWKIEVMWIGADGEGDLIKEGNEFVVAVDHQGPS